MPRRDAARAWVLAGSVLALGASGSGCALDRTGAPDDDAAQASNASGAGGSSTTTGASAQSSSGVTVTSGATSSGSDGGADSGGGSSSEGGSEPGVGGGGLGGGSAASSSGTTTDAASSSASTGGGPVCGNGVIEPPEECDIGDQTPGDRCSATCVVEHPDTCPGTRIPLAAGSFTITDTTDNANDSAQDTQGEGSCPGGNYQGPDFIYEVVPAVSGTLRAELDAAYGSHFLILRTSCLSTGTDILDCDYSSDPGTNDVVDDQVEAGVSYFVVVDSFGRTSGAFSLRLDLGG